jgi:hypothetical protein
VTEQPATKTSRKKKLLISGTRILATASLVLSLLWWIEFRFKQQQKALEERFARLEVSLEENSRIFKSSVESLEELSNIESSERLQEILNVLNASYGATNTGTSSPNSPAATTTQPNATVTLPEIPELSQALSEYYLWGLKHRRATLRLQLIKDNILFVIVLAIVGFGVYLSYIQFKKGDQPEGSLKLGPAGVEVTSSILGIFILAFSIGFFYLYLVHVFPIEEIGQQNLPPVAAPSTQGEE